MTSLRLTSHESDADPSFKPIITQSKHGLKGYLVEVIEHHLRGSERAAAIARLFNSAQLLGENGDGRGAFLVLEIKSVT